MKLKNIMNAYYGVRKEALERKLDRINEDYDESKDTTNTEELLALSIDGFRKGIWINGILVTAIGAATTLLVHTGHTVDKKSN